MKPFEVGDWQAHPSLNRLTRGAEEVRLEPKVMQVLEALAETPGEVVTREQLVARVWPDVFVSDDVLHRAIRELRKAFGDETARPVYVETIRKRGYRLIAPVGPAKAGHHSDPVGYAASIGSPAGTARGGHHKDPVGYAASIGSPVVSGFSRTDGDRAAERLADVAPIQKSSRLIAVASIALAGVLSAVVFALASRPAPVEPSSSSVRFVAMTSGPQNETDPAISPDGARLAFSMRPAPGETGQTDIYITEGPGRTPERVTDHPSDDRYPAWSSGASSLAFIRIDGRTCDIMLMPLPRQGSGGQAIGEGRERRLTSCGNFEEPRVSWSANGEWLVESFAPGPDPIRGWQIARVSTATGVRETLTLPPPGTLGDYSPSVSPDGTRIAFVRGINGATSDVHIVSISGGAPTRITWDNQDLVGLAWSADGQSLLYATDRAGGYTIWRTGIEGGDPQLVVGGAAKLKHPSVARGSGRVAYESWAYEINLWEAPVVDRLDLEGDLTSTLRPVVTTSDQWNHSPDLSPDEKQLAFVSTRSGNAEVWLSDRDGANARQLTKFGRASMRVPRWSPDAKTILISATVNGQPDLYAVALDGVMTRLTDDVEDEVAPSWSHDGTAVLFGARKAGTWQVMQLNVADRSRKQLTVDGGYAAQPSPDGKSILFTRLERPGVWTMSAEGGDATLLVPSVRAAENVNWQVTPSGIYYVGATADQPVVRRAPLSGGPGVDVAWIGNYSWPGFAITSDGRAIYAHWDRRDSNIMAIDR